MSFSTALSNDLATFFNTSEYAESITYTPSGGAATTITIIDDTQDATLQDPETPGDNKIILVKYSDVNTPGYKDTITWDSITWYIIRNVSGGKTVGIWTLEISRSARRQF